MEFVVLQGPVFYRPASTAPCVVTIAGGLDGSKRTGVCPIHRNQEVSRTVRITWIAQNLREIELAVGRRRHIGKPKEALGGRQRRSVRDPQRRLGRSVARLLWPGSCAWIVVAVGAGIISAGRQYRALDLQGRPGNDELSPRGRRQQHTLRDRPTRPGANPSCDPVGTPSSAMTVRGWTCCHTAAVKSIMVSAGAIQTPATSSFCCGFMATTAGVNG